ncbi:MAG TPA: hypothetical protein PKD83_01845 [Ignavibacteria bacterium]|nr:hypothetical protein [Ignavibacteria bacterium]
MESIDTKHIRSIIIFLFLLFYIFANSFASAQDIDRVKIENLIIWKGLDPKMKVSDLAAYCAPVFWYSSDEPELERKSGKGIRIPAAFPFDIKTDSPVVYYQLTNIFTKKNTPVSTAFKKDYLEFGNSVIDFSRVRAFEINYNNYYLNESGLGSHANDTEQSQFKFAVRSIKNKENVKYYVIFLIRVTAKAHALEWYDNIYQIDPGNIYYELSLPFNILVEEGKHANCTDMNGDGYYTPGYDVNVRKNDAWGLRDIIRGGELFSSDFQSWMAKVRKPEFRVLPPLPANSPLRKKYTKDSVYAYENAVYCLRPMPSPDKAKTEFLKHDMESYYNELTPFISENTSDNSFFNWFFDGNFINSIGISYRADEGSGISITFPLLIVKNVEAPIVGGWLVNRMYAVGYQPSAYGYNILYTPSASRFLDPYFSMGVDFTKNSEKDSAGVVINTDFETDFAFETGIKIRGNVTYSPLKFLSFLSPLWGIRLGIKNKGFMSIDHLNYIIEVGAGVW